MVSQRIGQKLKIIDIMLEKHINQRMMKLVPGLTPQQITILILLYESPEHREIQKVIESRLKISHATTRGIVRRLEKAGLLTTSPAPNDRRQSNVQLTTKGLTLMDKDYQDMEQAFEAADRQLIRGIDSQELQHFQSLLDLMIQNLS